MHEKGIKHQQKIKEAPNTSKIDNLKKNPIGESVKKFEIWISAYLAEHNIAFNAVDHLISGLKFHLKDPIVQDCKLGKTKATAIVKNVIGKCHQADILSDLKKVQFSLLIDESTDCSAIKSICICVRYFNGTTVTTNLLALVDLFDKHNMDQASQGSTAEHLYKTVINVLDNANIPHLNLIGFASDGCNTMMGANNSVVSRLKTVYPGIVILKCICHSLHLCASHACEELPRMCEDLARDIYNFFKNSSKRQSQFIEFQTFCNADPHKILRPSQTRWLSLISVVKRLLEQWDALKLFFNSQWFEHKTHSSEHINQALHNDIIKLYYLFLEYVLPKVTQLNEYFQSEKVIITDLHINICRMYKDILCCFLKDGYVNKTPIEQINPNDNVNHKNINSMYLGIDVMKLLNENKLSDNDIYDFRVRCKCFLVKLTNEIRKRYDFDNDILSKLHIFNPKTVVVPDSLFDIMNCLPRLVNDLDIQDVDSQWRMYIRERKDKISCNFENLDNYWHHVSMLTDYNNKYIYKSLGTFVLRVLSLPHSNAACERVFSKVNLVKTDIRNRLNTNTTSNILLASEHVKSVGGCNMFVATQSMLAHMTKNNLYLGDKTEMIETENILISE